MFLFLKIWCGLTDAHAWLRALWHLQQIGHVIRAAGGEHHALTHAECAHFLGRNVGEQHAECAGEVFWRVARGNAAENLPQARGAIGILVPLNTLNKVNNAVNSVKGLFG